MSFKETILKCLRLKPTKHIKHVGICIGHSRIGDSGAASVGGVSEWNYNVRVADLLQKNLASCGLKATVIRHYPRRSYGEAMTWLSKELKRLKCDVAIELHFNSASSLATGHEYLHLENSVNGKRLAACFNRRHKAHYPAQRDRGVKNLSKGERGYEFVHRVTPPAVICEPFFGSNAMEWNIFKDDHQKLAVAYAEALMEYYAE